MGEDGFFDGIEKLFYIDGLEDIAIDFEADGIKQVGDFGVCGDDDDGAIGVIASLAHAFGELDAIDFGHEDISDDEVDGIGVEEF